MRNLMSHFQVMQYFVVLTKECNLLCTYCGGGSDTPPKEIQYSVADLKSFLSKDERPAVEFYGGEPLLRIEKMKTIMDAVPAQYLIQTNGLFLDRIESEWLAKFHTILVSVDGNQEVTDGERGRGVYERVVRNSQLVRESGFTGDLIARMTVEKGTDVNENVRHLLGTGLFDHVHWQLSFSMFWKSEDETGPGLAEWISKYNSDVSILVDWWVAEMKRSHRVLGIVPFLGISNTLLAGEKTGLRCGSGIDFFTIMPDGRISACPVSVDFDFSMVGSIFTSSPDSLRGKATIGEPCLSCEVYGICGGRCLFVNRSQWLLHDGGYSFICKTAKHLIAELQRALPEIQSLIDDGRIKRTEFEYPGFNNGCEIIP
jgi:putative peptide-modifying radical SAM enzyme